MNEKPKKNRAAACSQGSDNTELGYLATELGAI